MKNFFAVAVVFFATSVAVLQGAKAPVCNMGGNPVDPTYEWVPGGDWKLIKVAPGQEVTMTSGSGKEVTCTLPGGQTIAYPPDGGQPTVVLCKNLITKGRPTGTEIPRQVIIKEKEVVKLVEKPAETPSAGICTQVARSLGVCNVAPPQVPKPVEEKKKAVVPPPTLPAVVAKTADPCVDTLEVLDRLRAKSKKKNAKISCTPQGAVEVVWDEHKPARPGLGWGSVFTGGPAYSPGYGYGSGGYAPAVGSYGSYGGAVGVGGYGGSGNYPYNTNTGPAWGRSGELPVVPGR